MQSIDELNNARFAKTLNIFWIVFVDFLCAMMAADDHYRYLGLQLDVKEIEVQRYWLITESKDD